MITSPLTLLSEHACFGGTQRFYQHESLEIGLPMKFSVFLPPQASTGPVPALVYLAGLTCNEETFMTKAGAQRLAAELGLGLIAPDTSPRGANVPGEADSWDFGVGAGTSRPATCTTRSSSVSSWMAVSLPPQTAPVSMACTPWQIIRPSVDQWPQTILRSRSARPGTSYQGYSPWACRPGAPFSSIAMRPRGVQ